MGRRIRVHDLDDGSGCLRVERFIGHQQRCSRCQDSIDPRNEVSRDLESGDRHRINLGTSLRHVPGHTDS